VIDVRWAGEEWVALGERALWWARRRTLCVADVHLGKAAAFRSAGVPVPESAKADLARLSGLIEKWGPERLVVLGDLLHARTGVTAAVVGAFADWRRAHRALDVLLVRGNHDVNAGEPPSEWGLRVVDGPCADGGEVRFCHDPAEAGANAGPTLCGHLHPAVRLSGRSREVRAACFWFGQRIAVLPAYGSFTGSHVVRPALGDRVLVVKDGEIAEAGKEAAPAAVGFAPG
jgi:DNA ligase-associated metallophosphoesterase